MADHNSLASEDWDSLVASIKDGRCVVMLGPDAVLGEDEGQIAPILQAFTGFLKRKLKREKSFADISFETITAGAETVLQIYDNDPTQLLNWAREFYERQSFDDPALTGLAGLDIGLVVNTIPGLPIERAWPTGKRSVAVYDRNGVTAPIPPWSVEQPLVYQLYGSLDQPRSMVLSDRDLLDVLVSVIREDPPLPANLVSTFRDPERTFLFLGFQLYHWQNRVLLHVLDKATEGSRRRNLSVALEMPPGPLDQGTRNFYSSGHGIQIVDMQAGQFVTELKNRVESGVGTAVSGVTVNRDAKPVFICHVVEDKAIADHLAAQLRSAGLNTWLDKDNLRGGNDWNSEIERTIKHDIGYIVVLQTRNMVDKREREQMVYVNKELRIALERQDYLSPNRIFIIPVIGDDRSSAQSDLSGIQWIDLTEPDGFERLVKDIKDDLQRGQRRW